MLEEYSLKKQSLPYKGVFHVFKTRYKLDVQYFSQLLTLYLPGQTVEYILRKYAIIALICTIVDPPFIY
jgi:hypothetical protein